MDKNKKVDFAGNCFLVETERREKKSTHLDSYVRKMAENRKKGEK